MCIPVQWDRSSFPCAKLAKIESDYRPSLALMVRWSFEIDATVDVTVVRRRCTLWRSCSSLSRVASPWTHTTLCGWGWQGCWCWSTRVVVVVGGGGGGGGGGWGREVSHVTPGSALCHLPFCCSAALICAHSSLVQDWDLQMGITFPILVTYIVS